MKHLFCLCTLAIFTANGFSQRLEAGIGLTIPKVKLSPPPINTNDLKNEITPTAFVGLNFQKGEHFSFSTLANFNAVKYTTSTYFFDNNGNLISTSLQTEKYAYLGLDLLANYKLVKKALYPFLTAGLNTNFKTSKSTQSLNNYAKSVVASGVLGAGMGYSMNKADVGLKFTYNLPITPMYKANNFEINASRMNIAFFLQKDLK